MTLSSPVPMKATSRFLRRCTFVALTASVSLLGAAALESPAFAQSDADKATARSLGQDGQAHACSHFVG